MAYNTKILKRDKKYDIIPNQYYNPDADQYEVVQGKNGGLNVALMGSYATITTAPVAGAKTVSTTAAELFAGASRLSGRYAMMVYNEGTTPVYWGGSSSVTTSTGFPLLPGDSVTFNFNPSVATPIYFIGTANTSVRVVELA